MKKIIFLLFFVLQIFNLFQYVHGICEFNGLIYQENDTWSYKCQNCSCSHSVAVCESTECELNATYESLSNTHSELNKHKHVRDETSKLLKSTLAQHKTINIQSGEAIKLIADDLTPLNLNQSIDTNKLVYILVSEKLKFGELKIKKLYNSNEIIPQGWTKINDIYIEKVTKEFTQSDLENGNVWYEPFSDLYSVKVADDFSTQYGSQNKNIKFDLCIFEVYEKDKMNILLSKEKVEFSYKNEVVNETVLGLEVLENQLTPLTFSNFEIAGIDSSKDYLVYRIIKNLEENVGQIEHASNPGVSINNFTQGDLNKGLILYSSPKEIGLYPREFYFTFIVVNDNRGDTFPETPFYLKVLPSNNQAPRFKEAQTELVMSIGQGLTLSPKVFEVEDFDSPLESLRFNIDKKSYDILIELIVDGQRKIINKNYNLTFDEIKDGSIRLLASSTNENESEIVLKVAVTDNSHTSFKTVRVKIESALTKTSFLRLDATSSMLLNVKEGQIEIVRPEHIKITNEKNLPNEIYFKITEIRRGNVSSKLSKIFNEKSLQSQFYFLDKPLRERMIFTQADIDRLSIRYKAPIEIGSDALIEYIYFDINDKVGNLLPNQLLTVNVEPVNNQPPSVKVSPSVKIKRGELFYLTREHIQIEDLDTSLERIVINVDRQPNYGIIESAQQKGSKISSFAETDLATGFTIRYVQNNQTHKRIAQDSFTFRVSDGLNESPIAKFSIEIDSTDYTVANLVVQTKALNISEERVEAVLSKSHFYVNENEENAEIVRKLDFVVLKQPFYGRFESLDKPGFKLSNFSYEQILTNQVKYVYELGDFQTKHDDYAELKINDKRNKNIIELRIEIQAEENDLPILQSTSYSIKVKELERKQITPEEISLIDTDSTDDQLKVIITHPPQYGTLEKINLMSKNTKLSEPSNNNKMISIDTSAKQKFNLILKFNNTNSIEENVQRRYVVVSEFTMSELKAGLIFYKHRSPGATQDSFGFVITDGTNDKYLVDNKIVSNHQIFTIYISPSESNQQPQIMRNFGLDYIDETIGDYLGRLVTSNELLVVDKDDSDNELIFEITEAPSYGTLEHKDATYSTINRFTQRDINTNKIFYRLDDNFKSVFGDHFKFNIYDSVKNSIVSNRFDIKWSVVSLEQQELDLVENEDEISVNVKKEGDLSRSSSVICKFVSDISDTKSDNNNNKSIGSVIYAREIVNFLENESQKTCQLKGVPPKTSIKVLLEEPKYSLLGSLSEMPVNILNSFELSSVSFSEDFFFVERSNDSSAFVTIKITRTGDLSQALSIRISTSDDTAIAGLDYKPKSELMQFKQDVASIDFKVEILNSRQMFDEQAEAKRFKVSLTVDDYLAEDAEETKYAYVLIHDKKSFLSSESSDLVYSHVVDSWNNLMNQFASPHLLPLTNSKFTQKNAKDFSVVPLGSSLVCLDPCRTENPNYIDNELMCSKLETLLKSRDLSIETFYAWEISASNEFGIYSKYVELANAFKVFSHFNQSILDSIYLQANFRVRCSIKLTVQHRNESFASSLNQNSPKLYSNIVEIKEYMDSSTSNSNKSCFKHWKDSMLQQGETNALHKLANDQTGSLFLPRPYFHSNYLQSIKSLTLNKPFVAKADYISADFIKTSPVAIGTEYLNLIRINVDIPYVEGVIPLISTLPLSKLNYNSSHLHVCSNFVQIDKEKYGIKHGFVSNSNLERDDDESKVAYHLTSSLNREKCMWKFVAYYDLSELTTYCQAKILTDSNAHYFQSRKNYLSVRIPLHISYAFVDSKATWSSLDYKTQLDVMVVYKSSASIGNTNRPINDYYDQNLNNQLSANSLGDKSNGTDLRKSSSKFVSFVVSKILINKEGKLILEFSTVPSFYGQFVKESSIEGPDHNPVQFDLELIWSQYTFDYPEQNWRAISKTSLDGYSGNYTIKLVPCLAQTGQAFKYPLECVQKEAIKHTIPISIENKFKPILTKYSLGTNLVLTKSLVLTNASLFEQNELESSFDENEPIYGIITLPNKSDVDSKLRLQSVYLCSSESSFTPTYDPDLRLDDKTAQLGCMTAHKSLNSRVLLLNRSQGDSIECTEKDLRTKRNQACFLTKILSNQKKKVSNSQTLKLDGFKFDSSLLFDKNDANKDLKWFVHVEFTLEPSNQARTGFSLVQHGTNMQMITLINSANSKNMYKNFNSMIEINKNLKDKQVFNHHDLTHIDKSFSYRNIYLKMFIPLIVIVILVLFSVFSILYCKKQSPKSLVMCRQNKLSKGQLKGATRYLRFKRLRTYVSTRLNVSKEKNYQLKIKKVNSDTYMKQEASANEQLYAGSSPLLEQAEINMPTQAQEFTEQIDYLNVNEMDMDNISNINSSIQQQAKNTAKIKDKWQTFNQRIKEYQSQKCNKFTNMFPNFSANKKDVNNNQQSTTSRIPNLKTIFEKSKSDLTTVIEKFRTHSYENNSKSSLNNHMPQQIPVNVDNLNKLQSHRNNYLYFNYNNNKMQLLNSDIMTTSSLTNPILNSTLNEMNADPNQTQVNITLNTFGNLSRSSSSDQITPVSSSTKCSITSKKVKRLSGTEV